MDAQPKLRLSRPTNHLEAILSFYVDGLGFEVLDRFDNQQGWDGVILGHRDWPYQFATSPWCRLHRRPSTSWSSAFPRANIGRSVSRRSLRRASSR